MSARRALVLERFTDLAPMTTNRYLKDPHGHGPQAAKALLGKKHADYDTLAEWRNWAAWEAKSRRWPPFTRPVVVEVRALRKGRVGERIDVTAAFMLAKAMTDGLTDAKLWPDDDDEHVVGMLLLPHLVIGRYGVRLTIREV
jgi:hypothetical protein